MPVQAYTSLYKCSQEFCKFADGTTKNPKKKERPFKKGKAKEANIAEEEELAMFI